MKVARMMTEEISAVSPDTTVQDVAKVMRDLNVGAVPVCEGEEALGIVTDRDITIKSAAMGALDTPIMDIMSKDLVYATLETTDQEALDIMSTHQIRRLPIMEAGKLVGILSFGDLAQSGSDDLELGSAISEISYPSKPTTEQ